MTRYIAWRCGSNGLQLLLDKVDAVEITPTHGGDAEMLGEQQNWRDYGNMNSKLEKVERKALRVNCLVAPNL